MIENRTNGAVREKLVKRTTTITVITKTEVKFIVYLLRYNRFVTVIVKGKISDKRSEEDRK